MKTRRLVHRLVVCLALLAGLALYLAPAAQVQKNSANASTQTKGGLNVVTFDTLNGKVIVNLPDDMMAGDTISGTVVAEPKGDNEGERARNADVLNGYVVEVKPPKQSGQPDKYTMPVSQQLPLIIFLGRGAGDSASGNTMGVMLSDPNPGTHRPSNVPQDPGRTNRAVIATATVHVWSSYGIPQMGTAADQAGSFQLPTVGQQGRPLEIAGPFDGNSSNTKVKIGGQDVPVLAESPRKAVFSAPNNVTGPSEIQVKEGNKETKGAFRDLGVNLTAPKTSLLKGESTELHVQVSGLEGITSPIPLHLTKTGVVSMQGGDVQTFNIPPSAVKSDGTFTTNRTITGQQAGAFSVIATVVVFNVCLQDDNNRNTLMFSSETGDFCSFAPGLNIAMASFDTGRGGVISGGGSPSDLVKSGTFTSADFNYNLTKNGAITAADFTFVGGMIHVDFNPSFHTGSGTVQTTKPKQTFTITDRDTRNNTCTCK